MPNNLTVKSTENITLSNLQINALWNLNLYKYIIPLVLVNNYIFSNVLCLPYMKADTINISTLIVLHNIHLQHEHKKYTALRKVPM